MQAIEQVPSHLRFDLLSPAQAASSLGTDPDSGLDPSEAEHRLTAVGPNELPHAPRDRLFIRVLRQLTEPMALLLIVAAAVAGLGLKERIDAVAILAIVVLNAMIGLLQEGKAARALEALKKMETPMSRVRRGGKTAMVPSVEVVPGDLVFLSAGERVPADLRLMEAVSLEIDESLLTGESLPVSKSEEAHGAERSALSERPSMAYSGTLITRGSGLGIAVATGGSTELGAIAERLKGRVPPTPLQVELGRVTRRLGGISVLVAAAAFGLIVLRTGTTEESLQRAFLSAVALAVAAVPEGLATVVAVALALGVRRMAARGAIIRRLPAVETLGSTTVIATDKTGTLTENRMRVESFLLPGGLGSTETGAAAAASRAGEVATLCNDASLSPPAGDPMEIALLEWVGPDLVDRLRRAHPRIASVPFDSGRKRMTVLHRGPDGALLLTKGAPEVVVERCAQTVTAEGRTEPLGGEGKTALLRSASEMAGRGMRVIALADRSLLQVPGDLEEVERDMTLVGLVGLRDPIRSEAAEAVREARAAGIRILMVTGDHAGTAVAIGEEAGLAEAGARVLTGASLRTAMPPDPGDVAIYARVDPDQKLALVEALRAEGHVVAVTGDGVNDAPALRRSDIGVAMGRSGSEVAREAADMVITDDNLATIVSAVREGRGIYDNIRKVVEYLIAGNFSEITVVVASLLLFPALGVPLLPLQLLWINLLTDGLPALALGVDPVDPELMTRPPRSRAERLLGGSRLWLLIARGLLIAGASIGSLAVARFLWEEPWSHARAVMFTVLVTGHLLYAFAARRPSGGLLTNRWLLVAVAGGLALQLAVVAWPAAHDLFGTASMSMREWLLVAVMGVLPIALMYALPGSKAGGQGTAAPRERERL